MSSEKSAIRTSKSVEDSSGDRRAGSVGENPELAASRDNGERSVGSGSQSPKTQKAHVGSDPTPGSDVDG